MGHTTNNMWKPTEMNRSKLNPDGRREEAEARARAFLVNKQPTYVPQNNFLGSPVHPANQLRGLHTGPFGPPQFTSSKIFDAVERGSESQLSDEAFERIFSLK